MIDWIGFNADLLRAALTTRTSWRGECTRRCSFELYTYHPLRCLALLGCQFPQLNPN